MKGNIKSGIGALLVAMLLLSMVLAPVSAKQEPDVGILIVKDVGDLYTDGDNNIATATDVGSFYASAGTNTFTVDYTNVNDRPLDGQGATFKLEVWDANGQKYSKSIHLSQAGSGTLSLTFSSPAGHGQYRIYSETDFLGIIEASALDGSTVYYV